MYADGAGEQTREKERKPGTHDEDFRNGTSKFHFATSPTSRKRQSAQLAVTAAAASLDSYRRARRFSSNVYRLLGSISLDEFI